MAGFKRGRWVDDGTRPPELNVGKVNMDKMVRKATCGACGGERPVDAYMKRHRRETQYESRPDQPTDSFYCGCQDDGPEAEWENPGQGFD